MTTDLARALPPGSGPTTGGGVDPDAGSDRERLGALIQLGFDPGLGGAANAAAAADRILASDWFRERQAQAWDAGRNARPQYLGPDDGHYNDDCMGWEDCYCGTYVNPYRVAPSAEGPNDG